VYRGRPATVPELKEAAVKEKPYCELWHLEDHKFLAEEVKFPNDFRLVAKVYERNPMYALAYAQYHRDKTDVVREYTATRPTRKNDIIIDGGGRMYLVDTHGLDRINLPERSRGNEMGL
jgi:hypothetical protein